MIFIVCLVASIKLIPDKKNILPVVTKQEVSDSKIKIILEDDSFDKVNQLIDSLINDAITMYYILNGVVEESYITEKTTKEIQNYVFGTVKKNMTNGVLATIGLFYKIDKEEDLDELLKLRIKLHLISEITKQNLPIE
jgi:hypothetical protein